MSTDIILYLVEGQKEVSVTNQLIQTFNDNNNFKILPNGRHIIYSTTIYGLYKEIEEYISNELDFDLLPILLQKDMKFGPSILNGLARENVSEIYLLFDFDPHATNFSKEKIQTLCSFFDNENENGKLFINYPMIEVFRHCYKITKAKFNFFQETCPLPINRLSRYKSHVSSQFPKIDRMDCQTTMKIVILNTILKANNLLNNQLIYPSNNTDITQKDLLEYQLIQNEKFHLLSGIPLLILQYHRYENLKSFLTIENTPASK